MVNYFSSHSILCRLLIICMVCQLVGWPTASEGYQSVHQKTSMRDFDGGSLSQSKSFRNQHELPIAMPSPNRVMPDPAGMRMPMQGMMGVAYQIHIVGEVRQPGTYRLTASDRLQEALQRAGGILPRGSIRSIEIRRGASSKSYDLLKFRMDGALQHNPYLLDNDVIHVPLRKGVVQVVGSVKRPNIYELKHEKSVGDLIALAGGLSIGVEEQAPIRLVRFVSGEKEILEVGQDRRSLKKTYVRDGDVIFVPNVLSAKNEFDYNVERLPGDQVFYPSHEDRVFVLGGVYNPGPYDFSPHYRINQYITFAGGTTRMGKSKKVKIIRSNGKTMKVRRDSDTIINPGDTIFVTEKRMLLRLLLTRDPETHS